MFSALLDTSVLVPSLTRDVLLQVAVEGVYRPIWSGSILDELVRTVDRILSDKDVTHERRTFYLERLLASMNEAFPDARTAVPDHAIASVQSPDLDDRHVIPLPFWGGPTSL